MAIPFSEWPSCIPSGPRVQYILKLKDAEYFFQFYPDQCKDLHRDQAA